MKPIRCLLFPCGSHIPPSLQFTTLRFISSRQLCSGRNDLRWLILEKRASCQWFHYTLARLHDLPASLDPTSSHHCSRFLTSPLPINPKWSQEPGRCARPKAARPQLHTEPGLGFLVAPPPVAQTVIFSPAFAGPRRLSRFLALCLNYAGYFVG